jgi:fatty-acyl-CoA synthase
LHCHPAVLEAQVIGVPDSLYGEQVMAWLILRGDRFDVKATEDSLRKHCAGALPDFVACFGAKSSSFVELAPRVSDAARCNCNTSAAHLSHFKVPKYFQFTKEFPVTVTGKVRKVELREAAKKLLGIDS